VRLNSSSPGRPPWWSEGIRFECQETGRCCVSHGAYGYVYLTLHDRRRLARHLGLTTLQFTRRYCGKTGGHFHLKDASGPCQFLEGKRCSVYQGRPTQCRTWPFWPENMKPKVWDSQITTFCPGVGKGRLYSGEEIRELVSLTSSV
jgi:Fe-S-cluster containining protein